MRQQSDAIRGLRWGAMAVTLGLAAVVVVRLADQSPAAQASAEAALPEPREVELVAGPGTPRLALISTTDGPPPEVPPPPPPAGWKPRVRAPRTLAMAPAPEPEPRPVAELGAPIILGLDEAPAVQTEPLVEETVIAVDAPEPEPLRPVIINQAKLHPRPNPAIRFVKTVGRVFGIVD